MALLTAKEILKVKLTGNYEKDRAFLISESEKMPVCQQQQMQSNR